MRAVYVAPGYAYERERAREWRRVEWRREEWRRMHRWTALAWLGGLVHSLGEGTDNGRLWFVAMAAIVAVPALALLIQRLSGTSQDSLTAR